MPRIVFAALASALILTIAPFAFSAELPTALRGKWKMDPDRSESAHQAVPIGPVTLIIEQSENDLVIETRRKDSKSSKTQVETLTYKLDGSETTIAGKDGAPITTKARWEGANLVTSTVRNIQGSTVTTLNIHSVDPQAGTMTVHRTLTVQHGYQFEGAQSYGTGTDVFVRAGAPVAK
ncbi:MAG: hypothetical protein M3Z85_09935 [Acidobacteriota bacterium]|nr:hypothetical protein [Acidobacteriota bacterium]